MASLFVTKLLVPQRPAVAILRPRLLSRLESAPPSTISLARGPAGYGKTTLLVDLVNESPAISCWVSLDTWDRDPAVLLDYLALSVRRSLPAADWSAADDSSADPRARLAEIINAIAGADSRIDIVLDDFHELDEGKEVLELVDYFALRLPANCRLFLASRTEPPLSSWARLAATGRAREIPPDELTLSSEEVRELMAVSGPGPVDDTIARQISETTRGWPVAVALATDGITEVGELHSRLSRFLGEEVLARLPDDVRDFLVRTSALEVLNAEQCAAMLEDIAAPMVSEMIDRLPTLSIPLTVITPSPMELRIHPLVREHIQSRLASADAGGYARMHGRAADLQLQRDRVSEALSHLASAEEWARIASVIAERAPAAYRAGRWHTVASWLSLLPECEFTRYPELSIWQARILSRLGRSDQALAAITQILQLGNDVPAAVAAELEAVRSAALRTKGEIGAAVKAGDMSRTLAVAANASVEVVAEARKELGLALMAQGSFEDGITELSAALEVQQLRGDSDEVAFLSGCVGSAFGAIGKLAESVAYLEQARKKFGEGHNSKELSWVLNNLGMTYWNLGDDEKARRTLTEALHVSREGGHRRMEGFARDTLADIDRTAGYLDAAREGYDVVLLIADEQNDLSLATMALLGVADVERRLRRYEAAEATARRAMASAESRLAANEEALAKVVLSRVARQQGKTDEAVMYSSAAAAAFEAATAARELGEALVAQAENIVDQRSKRAELNSTLRRLEEIATRLGHGQFILASDRALDILQYAVSRKIGGNLFRDLLRRLAPDSAGAVSDERRAYPAVEVTALGSFEVRMDGRIVAPIEWESEKSRELFLRLLVAGRPMTRDEIIADLWPDSGGKRSTSAFHSTLHRLRRALYQRAVIESGGWYSLQPDGTFEADVQKYLALTGAAGREEGDRRDALKLATDLYKGAFAPTLYSEWADEMRRTLERGYLEALVTLGQLLADNGEPVRAAEKFERALAVDRLYEPAWYGLLTTDLAANNADRAIRTYRRYETLLKSELGVAPEGRVAATYRRLRESRRPVS